jgi:hypothetical protein
MTNRRNGVSRPGTSRRDLQGEATSVAVPRGVLALLVGGLLVCLVALAFLLGQELGRWRQSLADRAPAVPASAPSTTAPPPVTSAPPSPSPPPAPSVDPWLGASVEREPTEDDVPAGQSEAVAHYFAELDALEGELSELEDPGRLASLLLQQAAAGDSSGFDHLLDALRQARERLQAMPAPAPCREHQRRSLELLDVGLGLADRIRLGVQQGDAGALLALTAEAQRLETGARELEDLARKIKAQYGLSAELAPRPPGS